MADDGFGNCLAGLMKNNPSNHECVPKCLAKGIGLQDTGQIRDWIKNRYAPKLDSPYAGRISEHLELTGEQSHVLSAAQAHSLALPLKPRDRSKRGDDKESSQFVSLLGSGVAGALISMLEDAPKGTGRDDDANTITLTWRSRDALPMTPAQRDRWDAALQSVLRKGWQIHYLVQLDRDGSRTVSLVQHMLDFIGSGAYVPRHFAIYPGAHTGTDMPASDLLVIPRVAAAVVYSAKTPHVAGAGILTHDRRQINALAAHARQLEDATVPFLQMQSAPESPAKAVKAIRQAEHTCHGRRLFKNGLGAFTQPPEWFNERTAPVNPGVVMSDDEWKRCLLHQRERIAAFERSVKRYKYRDICPLSALDALTRHGIYPRDDIFVAGYQTRTRRLEHLRHAITVLHDNENYQIGFVQDDDAASMSHGSGQRLDTMWQVTEDGNVYIGTWGPDATGQLIPVNLHTSEPTVAQGFREHFDQLWDTIPWGNRERTSVIKLLEHAIQTIEEDDTEE